MSTRIKICGVTRPEDARRACELGAWAVGMILSKRGPRALDFTHAEKVRREISSVAIGVFVDEPAETINEISSKLGLDYVQLHGSEPPSLLDELVVPAIKVLPIDIEKPIAPDVAKYARAWAVLLDAKVGSQTGGTGHTFDWGVANVVRSSGRRVVIAGGLTPENVRGAIELVRPFAVDVSSGVESAPGVKDPLLLERLFRSARET